MSEFFGFGGYQRQPEGYFSWQHLTFVSCLMVVMVVLAVVLGRRYAKRPMERKDRVLLVAAILIDGFEIFKIVMFCLRSRDPMGWTHDLPLFLCSIQLITIPMAALCKGRLKEAVLDFVCIFGVLGAVLGTYFAGQNYAAYPVLSLDNVVSGITHSISGFTSLYIMISGMASMKKENVWITFTILLGFCVAAYVANVALECNYMFLMAGDGTPYDILFDLLGGHPVLYPLGVVALFVVYILIFYAIFSRIRDGKRVPC